MGPPYCSADNPVKRQTGNCKKDRENEQTVLNKTNSKEKSRLHGCQTDVKIPGLRERVTTKCVLFRIK